jgi:hypothetical protein
MADFALYCRDDEELAQRRLAVKQMSCPVCGLVGALILHGPLRGCCGCARWGRVRGQRFWCSNRHRRRGCGHTFSMVFSWVLRGRQATAPQLWAFLAALRRGEGVARAWRGAAPELSPRTGWRLLRADLENGPSEMPSRPCSG